MTLLEYIKKNNWTMQIIAAKLDYTRTHISKVAHGKAKASLKLKRKIKELSQGLVNLQ